MSDIRSKILDLNTLKEKSITIQNSDKKIVFTNGCFDLLHLGHLSLFKEAKKNCDYLIVAGGGAGAGPNNEGGGGGKEDEKTQLRIWGNRKDKKK